MDDDDDHGMKLHIATYLLSCAFSIAFLVFLNAEQTFVLTDLLKISDGIGAKAGDLGFVDELVTIALSPLYGALSDKIGTKVITTWGYLVIGVSLIAFVQARVVYPDLLLLRALFAVGASACAAMVTTILSHMGSAGVNKKYYGRLAGLVGFSTGLGALASVAILLPLPALLNKKGNSMEYSIQLAFYIVGAIALFLSVFIYLGLRQESGKSITNLFKYRIEEERTPSYLKILRLGILAAKDTEISIAYIGGFVARSSSVAVSFLIPLYVNQYFIAHRLCTIDSHDPNSETKASCPEAYKTAAILSGLAETMGRSLEA